MAIIETQLFSPKLIKNVPTVVCVCPENTVYKILKPEIFNFSENVQEFTFWVVSSDQSPSNTNIHSIKKCAAMQQLVVKDLINTTLKSNWSIVVMASENEMANLKITAKIMR